MTRKPHALHFRLTARLLAITIILTFCSAPAGAGLFVNELHYDNFGTDVGEAMEVAGPAGFSLTGWSVWLYNGTGGAYYDTANLSGLLPNQQNGFGTVSFVFPSILIQNGSPDGFALVDPSNAVVQFLSYEGTFTATNGPAIGLTSTDIGVAETSATPAGYSLQLAGVGSSYADFTWGASPAPQTFGAVNTNQTFVPEPSMIVPLGLALLALLARAGHGGVAAAGPFKPFSK
jgi:hypothetical protein